MLDVASGVVEISMLFLDAVCSSVENAWDNDAWAGTAEVPHAFAALLTLSP